MTDGYESWWNVGIATTSEKKAFAGHVKVLWKEEKKQELTNRKKEETMGKVFGYPEFDENGEQILTTYDNEYKDMLMDVRVYRMKAGDEKVFKDR